MSRFRHVIGLAASYLLLGAFPAFAQGDCQNDTQYPGLAVTPDPGGALTTIATCSFEQEYSVITAIEAGATYRFTLETQGYITVREGAFDGPVVGQGFWITDVVAASTADLYAHWNVDDNCATNNDCVVTTVQYFGTCSPPLAFATVVEDCDQQFYMLQVDVQSLGSGSSVNITYDVFGSIETVFGVGLGVTELGPFFFGEQVSVIVEHESDPACNMDLGLFQESGECPVFIFCGQGAQSFSYCYANNEEKIWNYTSLGGSGSMVLTFISGNVQGSFNDVLTIYDGTDNTGTLLFANPTTTFDLTGLVLASTTGSFHIELITDAFTSCDDGSLLSWNWQVECLNCQLPVASATVLDDCPNNQFGIAIDVASLGDGSSVTFAYAVNGGLPTELSGVGLGETVIGPFTVDDIVSVFVQHESDPACTVALGSFTDTGTCPSLIDCGSELNVTYCPGDGENSIFYYQGTGTFPLALFFNGGSLETCCDHLFVYDGPDTSYPLLTPVNGVNGDLTGLFFSSTNPGHSLTIQITTDGSVSCETGFQTELDYTLSCLDCIPVSAAFEIVQDCEQFQFFISVEVTDMGTDPDPMILNSEGLPATTITAVGTYQIGPFVSGTEVDLTIENDANSLCNVYSGTLVNPLCPTILCGGIPLQEAYCYGNNEDFAWAYEVPTPGATMQLIFNRGTIESSTFDVLTIYDGPGPTAPVLFQHNLTQQHNLGPDGSAINSPGAPYYAVNVTSSGTNLYMTLTSDGSVSCQSSTGTYDEWSWQVQCIGCSAPGTAYNVVPDCLSHSYMAEVIVTTAPSADGMTIANVLTGQTQSVSGVGVYSFGPYPLDSLSILGVTDLSEPGCLYLSDSLTYPIDSCVIASCGFDNYDYCYENNADRWYTYQSSLPVPSSLIFLEGHMLSGDQITVYNGYDASASILYQGNFGGNLAGFAVNTQNVEHVFTLRIRSNGSGSCEDGQVNGSLHWTVGCGAVGIEEALGNGFSLYPNPTDGQLYLSLGQLQGLARVRILDMSGRSVAEETINVKSGSLNSLDLAGLQSGQYLVQVSTTDWTKVQRVEVQH